MQDITLRRAVLGLGVFRCAQSTSRRVVRGSNWGDDSASLHASCRSAGSKPPVEGSYMAFRVTSVPEPGSLAMLAGIALAALL